ncbi:MAG: hypothetical protein L0Y32_01805 [Nevskiales bacterium]|nr:hypothetical protein [Nevskiales bacterium]
MNFFLVRSFDHAGYYEMRLVLTVIVLGVAIYYASRRRDQRYLIAFASGVFFHTALEIILQSVGMRGKGFSLSVFGVTPPQSLAVLLQGMTEGGTLCMMGFWFADLCFVSRGDKAKWRAYLAICALMAVSASVIGYVASGHPITSPRPMFSQTALILSAIAIATMASVLVPLLFLKGRAGLRYLGWWYLGVVIYTVLIFEPLHLLGARYIAVQNPEGQFVAAAMPTQVLLMLYSHLYEVAGSKIHYFGVPYLLGLLKQKG